MTVERTSDVNATDNANSGSRKFSKSKNSGNVLKVFLKC